MKKGYYIHFDARIVPGVDKKIGMQINELEKHFNIKEINIKPLNRSLIRRVFGLFPTASIDRDYEKALTNIKNPDFLYVRRATCDRAYLDFFRRVKEEYPECKILIEIFTYPYDRDEYAKWNAWPFWIKEKIYRNSLKNYIDYFVTYSDDKEIFGVPTINSLNGVDVGSFAAAGGEINTEVIRLIGIAYMQRQHGYERIIRSIAEYNHDRTTGPEVRLMLVGDGPEKKKYVNLVERLGIKESVSFFETTRGKDLDDLFNNADIGLIAFGLYKVGRLGVGSAIKTGEYMARGIPIINGYPDVAVKEGFEYSLEFSNDDKTIPMEDVISFYRKIYSAGRTREAITSDIREYAFNNVGMDSAMRPIVEIIGN